MRDCGLDLKWFSALKYVDLTDQTIQNIWARSGTGPKWNGPEMGLARNGSWHEMGL